MAIKFTFALGFACVILTGMVVDAKVVVFFPMLGANSHILYHSNVAREVAALGHEAWVCIPEMESKNGNLNLSGVNPLYYKFNIKGSDLVNMNIYKDFLENKTWSYVTEYFQLLSAMDQVSNSILRNGISDQIKALKPDLFVIDSLSFVRGMYVVPYKLGIPYAVVGTVHDAIPYRIPFSPVATPTQITPTNDLTTLWNRLRISLIYVMMLTESIVRVPDFVSMFAPEKPHKSISELMALAEVYIVELDPIMDYARPTLPNTKLIGAMAVKPSMPLTDLFKEFVDRSNKGLVVISFGSAIVSAPDYIFEKFNAACLELGLNIVWRLHRPTPDPKRILTHEWIPQNDILGHRNTKLFISHCGANGQYESLDHGVPMLCVPIFGDQPYNSERITRKGYGLTADMRFIAQPDLTAMIRELITNRTYKQNIAQASKLFRLLYKSPMKEAAFWLDHVMEYGGDYMRASSQKMPLYQFLMLDVLAVVAAVIVTVLCILFCFIRVSVRVVCRRRQSKSKSE